MGARDAVRVGIAGSGYVAGVHSAAYRAVAGTYQNGPEVELVAAADVDHGRAATLADGWGWGRAVDDWRALTRSDDIDVVDICVPNVLHAEIALDALAHGKHVICEKPLAHGPTDAAAMCRAAESSGLVAQVCFYYRVWPAISWARDLLDAGAIGEVRTFRGWMLQDYAADPDHDLGWRSRRAESGAGATGDLGSHIIDLARYLCGDVTSVCATTHTLIDRHPPVPGLDDLVSMLVEFEGGASGVLEASWSLRGHHCDLGFDLVGTEGAIRFSWERSNEIEVMTGDVADPLNGYRRILIGRGQPDVASFISVPGQAMGYRDAFTIGLGRALGAIGRGDSSVAPSFRDGLAVSLVIDAVLRSAAERAWVEVEPAGGAALDRPTDGV